MAERILPKIRSEYVGLLSDDESPPSGDDPDHSRRATASIEAATHALCENSAKIGDVLELAE